MALKNNDERHKKNNKQCVESKHHSQLFAKNILLRTHSRIRIADPLKPQCESNRKRHQCHLQKNNKTKK